MSLTTMQRAAAAELVETLVREHAGTVEDVVRELVQGRLRGCCTEEDVAGWHRTWKRRQRAAETWHQGDEIPVDPAALEQQAAGDGQAAEEAAAAAAAGSVGAETAPQAGEIAAGM